MAQLDPSNIVNGNTIAASDLLQLYNALTAGGGYDVSISGSLTGSATTATSATSASNITTAITGGGTHYLTFVAGAGTKAPKIASLLEYTPSTNNLQVTASFATSASFAANATPTQLNSQGYSNIGAGPVDAIFKFYAGKVRIVSSTASTANFPGLAGKTLGTNVWVTATIEGSAASFTNAVVTIKALSAGGALTFETLNVPDTSEVHYHVIYVP
jgi:hypothetical protein